ncbi:hypothetical protein ACS0TY_002830 [Phlomoides rotata]
MPLVQRREYRVVQSTSTKWKWWLRAKLGAKSGCWEISRLGPPHSCFMDTDSRNHQNLYKNLLAGDMEGLVKVDPAYDVKYVIERANSKYNYTISYQKAWQALKRARENVYGLGRVHVSFCPSTWVHYKDIILGPLWSGITRRGLMECSHWVAYAIVDDESYGSWKWFLDALATHVVRGIQGVCLISDRHAGILKVVDEVPAFCEPIGVHRYCLRHTSSGAHKRPDSRSQKADLSVNILYQVSWRDLNSSILSFIRYMLAPHEVPR